MIYMYIDDNCMHDWSMYFLFIFFHQELILIYFMHIEDEYVILSHILLLGSPITGSSAVSLQPVW